MTDFEFTSELQVRFRDIDAMHHVNNAVYASYLEQARLEYYEEVIGVGLTDIDTVLVHLEIDYRRPIEMGESPTVHLHLEDIGESSNTMTYEIRTNRGVAATAETVQVFFDPETEQSKPIPGEWREKMLEYRDQ
ncbi:acyl-CoA thioesterase [Haloplanus sp. GCM10025708]|uniref:acyl-CoA thioesterase n=1 Tax=Haloferacaceae TaxID=1644056 RepID=UPI00360F6E0A